MKDQIESHPTADVQGHSAIANLLREKVCALPMSQKTHALLQTAILNAVAENLHDCLFVEQVLARAKRVADQLRNGQSANTFADPFA